MLLCYFVKKIFKYKKFPTQKLYKCILPSVPSIYIDLCENLPYWLYLFKRRHEFVKYAWNMWNMDENKCVKYVIVSKWCCFVDLYNFRGAQFRTTQSNIYDGAFLQKYCKYMCNILYTCCIWLYLHNFKCVLFRTTPSNMHLWWSFFAKIV